MIASDCVSTCVAVAQQRHQARRRHRGVRLVELLVLDAGAPACSRSPGPSARARCARGTTPTSGSSCRAPSRPSGQRDRAPSACRAPAISPSSTSPRTTAATPAGVPVKIRSPGCSAQAARQVLDDLGHAPDQLATDRPVWRDRAVDLERDRAARRARRSRLIGRDRADRRGLVEGLADAPRPALLLGLVLQVAARHVEADARSPRCAPAHRLALMLRPPLPMATTSSISWCRFLVRLG